MPATPAIIAAHIEANGAYMFHVTHRERADVALTAGMRPGAESFEERPFFESRPNHVYLSSLERTPLVVICGVRVVLRVDLRRLDPKHFDTDEDQAQGADLQGSPWVTCPAPKRVTDQGQEAEGQRGALAQWAETTPGFDVPAIVAKSLAAGSAAYSVAIPSEAIEEAHEPSAGAEAFMRAAETELSLERGALGDFPLIDDQYVELARAYAMAEALIEAATGQSLPADLRDDFGPRHISDELRRAGRNSSGLERRTLLLSAGNFAGRCEPLNELPGLSNIERFVELAGPAADVLGVIETFVDRETALSAAEMSVNAIRDARP